MFSKYFIFFIIIIFTGILFIPNKLFAQQSCLDICNTCFKGTLFPRCDQADCNTQVCDYIKRGDAFDVIVPDGCLPKSDVCPNPEEPPLIDPGPPPTDDTPGPGDNPPFDHDDQLFIKFLNWLFPVLLSVAAILAFLKIVFAGFKWIAAAGNPSIIENAKDAIIKAVLGLVLAFVAWLILWTISPALVGFSSGIPPPGDQGSPPPGDQGSPPPTETLTHDQAVALLSNAPNGGIQVTSTGGCSDINNPNCTSLEGIPASTINSLITIKQACGCSMTVTGGTETGHQTHGPGLPVVDLALNDTLASYLKNNTSSLGISAICTAPQDAQYRYNCNFDEDTRHIHVSF